MSAVVTQADREAADRLWMATTGDWPRDLIEEDAETLNLFVQAFARHRSEAVEELVEVLGPFALMAEVAEEHGHGPGSSCEWRMSYDDFAAARALVAKHRGEQG